MLPRWLAPVVLALVAKPVNDWLRRQWPREPGNAPDCEGYCTWCHNLCRQEFHKRGWPKRKPPKNDRFGIGESDGIPRHTYRCSNCKELTTPCMSANCNGMARAWEERSHDLCGKCCKKNDVNGARVATERTEADRNKFVEILHGSDREIRDLKAELANARRQHREDSALLDGLMTKLRREREKNAELRRMLGLQLEGEVWPTRNCAKL